MQKTKHKEKLERLYTHRYSEIHFNKQHGSILFQGNIAISIKQSLAKQSKACLLEDLL